MRKRGANALGRLAATALAAGLLTFAAPAYCWNDFGHMTVAYIAYKKLTPQTRERVDQLLKLCPAYGAWLGQIGSRATEAERNAQIFMLASTWPDTIKGDHRYKSDGTQNGFRPDSPEAAQNIGYGDFRLHKYWHFLDQPFTYDRSSLPPADQPNALTQMALFRSTLASDQPDELKSFDLVWLIHIVGDLHQPLHCVTRVSRTHPAGDNGGNDVKLAGAGDAKNLHGLWDCMLGRGTAREVIVYADSLPDAPAKAAARTDLKTWMDEGFKLAKSRVYCGPIKKGDGPFEVDESYIQKSRALAEKRAELGGARLANLLNSELK